MTRMTKKQTPSLAAPICRSSPIDRKREEGPAGVHRPNDSNRAAPHAHARRGRQAAAGPRRQAHVETPIRQQRDKKGHPLFDAQGKPVMQTKDNLGYDENGKKLHASKVKPPKTVAVSISRGILTVDGLTGKAALNYEIKDFKYMYFYVPGVGTTVVSNGPFPGAVEQKHAFDAKTLTVTVGEHVLQLSSDKEMLGKAPQSAFVLVDKYFTVPTRFPVVGYGPIRVAPYAWPGSRVNEDLKGEVSGSPPLPVDLRPTLLLQSRPAGQMRPAGPPVLPGQTAPPQPCMPIAAATATNQAKK